VHDAKYINPEEPARPMFFTSLDQREKHTEDLMRMMEERSHFMRSIQLLVRGSVQNLEPQLRAALADVDPTLTIVSVHSLQQQVDTNFDQQRMVAQLTGTFGIVALLLAAIGLYGLTAYSVVRRTSEIGIRMAVGANRLSIVGMVLRGAFLQVGIGLAIGIPLSVLAGRMMATQLFQVQSWDPKILIGSTLALAACAMIASVLPARRAASTDPLKALRTE
jgi:ABC-type antimicrobial peptide transport system permease subunit